MSQTAWPTALQVKTLITTDGAIAMPSAFDYAPSVASAITQFERYTGWEPFLPVRSTRLLDPPGPKRPLLGGQMGGGLVLQLPQGATTIYTLTVNGVTKTSGTDFYVGQNHVGPIKLLRFIAPVYSAPLGISIDADWGYNAIIPDDAWLAVEYLAAANAIATYAEGLKGGYYSIKDDDVTLTRSVELVQKLGDSWLDRGMKAAAQFPKNVRF